jgi:hypothetical protein
VIEPKCRRDEQASETEVLFREFVARVVQEFNERRRFFFPPSLQRAPAHAEFVAR